MRTIVIYCFVIVTEQQTVFFALSLNWFSNVKVISLLFSVLFIDTNSFHYSSPLDLFDIFFQFENLLFAKLKNNAHVKKIAFKVIHIRIINDDIDKLCISQISVVLFVVVVIRIIKIVIVRLVVEPRTLIDRLILIINYIMLPRTYTYCDIDCVWCSIGLVRIIKVILL